MIGFVRGTVDYLDANYCLLDTGGIGYRIYMPANQLEKMALGQEYKAYTYMAVREDAIVLYGFLTKDYYELFLQLIGVSGVGPKIALGILGTVRPDDFCLAIQMRNMQFLQKLPGVGKKTAERMILELKDKLGGLTGEDLPVGNNEPVTVGESPVNDAIAALVSLGYSNNEVAPIFRKMKNVEALSTEALIREALKQLAGRK